MNFQINIANSSSELNGILDLRYKVLRAPWNQSLESATDENETQALNAYVQDDSGQIIACGRLHKISDQRAQIRYMAVEPDWQGKGLGASILQKLESEALKLGHEHIELQARENAVPFYTSKGYRIAEKSFLLWGQIQHYRMEKELTHSLQTE